MSEPRPIRILFVCAGNICRSPLAEGVFIHLAAAHELAHRFEVDSAGTGGWHIGRPPDPRSVAVAAQRGIHLPSRARQIDPKHDFPDPASQTGLYGQPVGFDLIIAADLDNVRNLRRRGGPPERIRLLRSYDPGLAHRPEHEHELADPYYGNDAGFERCYEHVHDACAGLIDQLLARTA